MPPQRRQREYETAVDPEAIHAEPEKLAGFGEKRTVIKDAELEELLAQAQQVAVLREQLSQALEQQGRAAMPWQCGKMVRLWCRASSSLLSD